MVFTVFIKTYAHRRANLYWLCHFSFIMYYKSRQIMPDTTDTSTNELITIYARKLEMKTLKQGNATRARSWNEWRFVSKCWFITKQRVSILIIYPTDQWLPTMRVLMIVTLQKLDVSGWIHKVRCVCACLRRGERWKRSKHELNKFSQFFPIADESSK